MTGDEAEIIQAFRNAGIPKRYHAKDVGLSQKGLIGEELKNWLSTDAKTDISLGKGRTIQGDDLKTMDICYLLARGLLLHRLSVLVVPLISIAEGIGTYDFRERLNEPDVLVVPDFYDNFRDGAFTKEKLFQMDWFFRKRLTGDRTIIPHITGEIRGWWSPTLLMLIQDRNGKVLTT